MQLILILTRLPQQTGRDGFTRRFGLVYIDLENNLARHPKSTAYWFANNLFGTSQPTFSAKQKAVQQQKAPAAARQQKQQQAPSSKAAAAASGPGSKA